MGTIQSLIKQHWEEIQKLTPTPRRIREIKELPFDELDTRLASGDVEFIKSFISSVYAGDLYILKKAFPTEWLNQLKSALHIYGQQHPQESHQILDGVPDFHIAVSKPSGPKDGYVAVDHSYYFFPWNKDPLKIFSKVKNRWRTIKTLGGFAEDEYENHLPSQLAVDRVQVIHYPKSAGYISAHFDPHQNQRFVWGAEITRKGKDFNSGGFYVFDQSRKKRYVEDEVEVGSVVLFFPSIVHGVDIVDEGGEANWSSPEGRWYIAMNTVDAHCRENRLTALPPPSGF